MTDRLTYQYYDRFSQTSEGVMDWFYNRDTGGFIRPVVPGDMSNGWIQLTQNNHTGRSAADSDRTSVGDAENATFTTNNNLRRSGSEASVTSPEVTTVPNTPESA